MLRKLPESVTNLLVDLAKDLQVELSVLVEDYPIQVKGGKGLPPGWVPLTLDQVDDACMNDPVELNSLGWPGEPGYCELKQPIRVRYLDLYVRQTDVEQAGRLAAAVALDTNDWEMVEPPRVSAKGPARLEHLAEAERALLKWAEEMIAPRFNQQPRPIRRDVVPLIARKARELGFQDVQTRAKWVWFRLNPHKKPGAPRGPRGLRATKKIVRQ